MIVGWLDTEDVRGSWADASQLSDDELIRLLASAYSQCVAYLPPEVESDNPNPPASWMLAQEMQARALYRSGTFGSNDQYGQDGMAVTAFPMDWTVKRLLRPERVGRVL